MGIARHGIWLASVAAMGITGHATAIAAPATTRDLHVPAGPLASSLLAVGKATDTEIQFRPEDVAGAKAPALNGEYSAEDAVRTLTAGTSLKIEIKDGSIFVRGRSWPEAPSAITSDIVVTGTRIRGGSVASPVIQLSQERMREEGFRSLADVARSIPQNFSGGQTPGLGLNTPGNIGDETGGTSMNLRGLGPDATLTLLNGHRLSYSGDSQAIDISSIPFLAIDRIEIVPDGSSALYGSDAVAGVANIILKKDYVGLTASADWAGSTDGGNNAQRYGLLAGTRWESGSITAAYEYARNTPIRAEDRSYTRLLNPGAWLYPGQHHNDASINLRQDISSNLSFTVDAVYNARRSEQQLAIDQRGEYLLNGLDKTTSDRSFTVAPSLKWQVSPRWTFTLSGTYGQDHTRFAQLQYLNYDPVYQTRICYCDSSSSAELAGAGPIFALPGGDAEVAVGTGYRSNTFEQTNEKINVSQKAYYGYGEIDLPFVSPNMDIRFIRRLSVTGALRYERYPGIGDVFTPKIGMIYSPTSFLDFKGSWGKSFKAPTLFQRYFGSSAALYYASSLGGQNYPATATALYTLGGNPNLKPERATTWSATMSLHPSAIPGLKLEGTVFGIVYRDRVITPIGYQTLALSDPIYADLVNFDPSEADKAAVVAAAQTGRGLFNLTGLPYNAANVVAIVYNNNINAARQSIHGIDFSAEYLHAISPSASFLLSASGTYLDSSQRRSALQQSLPLSGTIFNPPHFRGRAGATIKSDRFSISTFVDYIGNVHDVRATPATNVHSMTTWDLSAIYRVPGFRFAKAMEIGLGVDNITNAKPATIAINAPYLTAFDTTNYSPFGRTISGSILFRW